MEKKYWRVWSDHIPGSERRIYASTAWEALAAWAKDLASKVREDHAVGITVELDATPEIRA